MAPVPTTTKRIGPNDAASARNAVNLESPTASALTGVLAANKGVVLIP